MQVQGQVLHLHTHSYVCIHVHGRLYMPAVCTDTCVWVHVPGCVYVTVGVHVSPCLSLRRWQTQETRKNRKEN